VKFTQAGTYAPGPLTAARFRAALSCRAWRVSPLTDLRSLLVGTREIWHCASHLTGESRVMTKSTAGDSYNVFLVEDEALIRMMIIEMLEALGHRISPRGRPDSAGHSAGADR
jgi:hypothetical protein